MEVGSRGKATELQVSRKWKGRDHQHQQQHHHHHHHNLYQKQQMRSPERTKVWTEPPAPPNKNKCSNSTTSTITNGGGSGRKVPVIYYLSRNGQLEHPHFMDVLLSSPEGLYLRDVINRLNLLRGKGMASQYSWSSKRSYKNGFVWHDLSEDDFIYPAQGQEYVLKGSELLELSSSSSSSLLISKPETASSASFRAMKSGDGSSDFPVVVRRRNQSWSSIDLNEYKVYKTEPASESTRRLAADASTQTDDKRRRRRTVKVEEDEEKSQSQSQSESQSQGSCENQSTELSREEISPPPSDSSPETLESLMKADGRLILCSGSGNEDNSNRTADNYPSGRMKASTVLMQLISCGSISFKDCGPSHEKDQGFSLLGHYKARLPRGAGTGDKKEAQAEREISNFSSVRLEDKEYFSGSLIETNKNEDIPPALKRSNSYNADRSSQMKLMEKEIDGVRAKCIPRRPKAVPTKKEGNMEACGDSDGNQNVNKNPEV